LIEFVRGALDWFPDKGYVVSILRLHCRARLDSACWPVFFMTVVIPLLSSFLAWLQA
jgi:hypothetical protein